MSSPFNEEKYKALLEGLEISEILLSDVIKNNRIDAECYRKINLYLNHIIETFYHKPINDFATVTDGEHGSPDLDDNSGILYLSGHNVKDNVLDLSDVRYCSKELHNKNSRSALRTNSVLLSIVGTVGNASVVYQDLIANTDRNVATIKNIADFVNPYYLSTFLNSKYGKYQMQLLSTGNVQPLLNLLQVKSIKVCIPNMTFQSEIEQVVKSAHSNLQQSKSLYFEAEDILLSELGLKDWQPNNNPINIKQLKESFLASGRLDAEYYQSKYDDLFAQLSKYECDTIKGIANIKKSVEPGSEAYQDKGIPFVRVSDVTKFGISDPSIFLSPNDFDLKELQPKKNTILLSKDGSVGIAYKVEKDMDCITSGALLHLSIFNEEYNPDYLTLVLNSIVVQMQAERDSNGAIIQHWKPSEIEQVIIPKLPKPIQDTISAKIQESFALKAESKRLLDEAKRLVEREIEKR